MNASVWDSIRWIKRRGVLDGAGQLKEAIRGVPSCAADEQHSGAAKVRQRDVVIRRQKTGVTRSHYRDRDGSLEPPLTAAASSFLELALIR